MKNWFIHSIHGILVIIFIYWRRRRTSQITLQTYFSYGLVVLIQIGRTSHKTWKKYGKRLGHSGKIVRENECDKKWHDNLKQDNTSALGFIFHPAFRGIVLAKLLIHRSIYLLKNYYWSNVRPVLSGPTPVCILYSQDNSDENLR